MTVAAATHTRWRAIETPVGDFIIIENEPGAITARWTDAAERQALPGREDQHLLPGLVTRLTCYFAGGTVSFDDIPTPPGPAFHTRCWAACRAIPVGATISYAELAARAGGDHLASRAAGQAMRRNRLPVIIPCHRVVASSGRIGGYAGSADPAGRSLARKRYLLDIERHHADRNTDAPSLFQG